MGRITDRDRQLIKQLVGDVLRGLLVLGRFLFAVAVGLSAVALMVWTAWYHWKGVAGLVALVVVYLIGRQDREHRAHTPHESQTQLGPRWEQQKDR